MIKGLTLHRVSPFFDNFAKNQKKSKKGSERSGRITEINNKLRFPHGRSRVPAHPNGAQTNRTQRSHHQAHRSDC
jgi:hypothetical protein